MEFWFSKIALLCSLSVSDPANSFLSLRILIPLTYLFLTVIMLYGIINENTCTMCSVLHELRILIGCPSTCILLYVRGWAFALKLRNLHTGQPVAPANIWAYILKVRHLIHPYFLDYMFFIMLLFSVSWFVRKNGK